ncbi:hypothetical protein [Microbulbifer halophilus]|uniref:Uncharacterized protein n=1 Tax=Microbulbifer halophilus TaxID=453963 RepID=A0ABW5E8D9_9GAMM|nr:hypothetical protein [Microbulbifer halophilus]MCW8125411.1 hypothetical protein [Microbulbifer halophilus]
MWPRSIAGIFLGLLISISLILNLVQLLPLAQDVKLLIGLLTAFVLWGGIMTYCYYSQSIGRASLNCAGLLVVSGLLNAALLYGNI